MVQFSQLIKRNLPVILGLAVVIFIGGGAFFFLNTSGGGNQEEDRTAVVSEEHKEAADGTAVIETDYGRIVIKFFPEIAPGHVENFIKLAKAGYYDGTTFHRVIPGFMIQGGDPNTKDDDRSNDGMGGPGYSIEAEFSAQPHRRGIVSMARSPAGPNTAGSQFFIVVETSSFLDGSYTIFGEVIEGMDVVDQIVNVERDGNDNPLERIVMKKVVVSGL